MTTLFDRLWDAHVVAPLDGGAALIAIDRVLLHERTGAAALNALSEAGRKVQDPARVFAIMDHIVDTLPGRTDRTLMPGGQAFITETRAAAQAAGITLFDVGHPDQGIMHVVSPELGIVLPGLTLIAPDSHTCTQGALGALAWGIGSSEAEHAMATGTLRLTRPKSMRATFSGQLAPGVTAKDMMLALIAAHGAGGGAGHVVEFAGEAVTALDLEARMTLCNMATEFSAFAGLIAPDEVTFAWLKGRRYAPQGASWDAALAQWRALRSDADAVFDAEIAIDASTIAPMVSWGTSPQASVPVTDAIPADASSAMLDYMALQAGAPLIGTPVDAAFIGSCTNARLSDLRRAAALLKGRKVAAGIRAICVPGSSAVRRAAEAEGLDRVFLDAGFEWRESGCSMCFFAGGESFGDGSRVISSTNRNFESRQGLRVKTHIASPETVAASALAGAIADARDWAHG
ncbi:3-isopropylmalate dehydratase large subunit [Blastomonas natatoria]|uniref:3-isopropylmalate dehydratase n=1 Tax=Blastomonas natatoria TaxID=34015 RepID=A0A2V3VHZ7_9SPHN|nr:3-isopropylmalate dehydratase large subunit [Blastomonas natatoria]PXW76239.1 3-isopropylmalate dehydratase large subunit [Blastomonas natatoria]